MKTSLALAVVSLVLYSVADAGEAAPEAGGDSSVAAASKKLETARENLTKAVQSIKKDSPSAADLDSALAAVGALKDAIEAGAEQEQKDLDYAKAALAARKELRTHREFVDQQRAKVHIFDRRRTIDGALTSLSDRAKRVEAKEASPKDFDDAREAVEALRKLVDEARPLAKEDEKFARYIADADAALARQGKSIDDRWTARLVEKQRALVEESRRALSASTAALGKDSTDAQFEGADKAASELSKCLEAGKVLEVKDKAYRAEADKTRAELAQSKKKLDALWTATGAERLKAEIEPARKDLVEAGKAVRTKAATPDQLAEAKTAAIVVRRLLEKFQPQASRSQAFGQYVGEVKKTLVEVEVGLSRRTLDSARAALAQALKPVEGKEPTDAQFAEAYAAAAALEKTLEPMQTPEPAIAPAVAEAKAALAAARSTVARRRVEVGLDPARVAVVQALKPIDWKAPTDAQFADANTALAALEKALEKMKEPPDPAMARSLADARTQLGAGRATMAKRRVEVTLDTARASVVQAMKPLEKRAVTDEQFAEAKTALSVLEKTLETMKTPDPAVAKAVADAQALLGTARTTAAKRRVEVSLDVARTALAQALKPLEKPAPAPTPTDEQLAEAYNAMAVLEKTLEAVQKNEDAAAAIAEARTVLGTARTTVAKRRVEVQLDPARAALALALKPIDWKAPTDAQFEAANAALEALEKALQKMQSPKDEGVAKPVADGEAQLGTARATVAKRRVEVSLDAARAAVSLAMKPLEKRAVTDEQFAQANAALAALEKTLASLQTKDPSVAKPIADSQALLSSARIVAAMRRVEVSLDVARAAVVQALRPLEKPAPTDEQFAQANAALAALEKTLEAVQKNEDAAASIAEARTALATARTTAAKRRAEVSLGTARAGLAQALKPLVEKLNPTDEQFAEASSALTVLEKTLESVQANKEAAAAIAEARTVVGTAKTTLSKRRLEVDVLRQRAKVEDGRKAAATAMVQIQAADAAKVQEAEAALKQLREVLGAGTPLIEKDRVYAAYDVEVKKRIAEMSDKIAARKIVLAASDGRALLTEAIAAAKSKIQAARLPEATDGDIDAAAKSVEGVLQGLETRAPLEEQDDGWATYAGKARDELKSLKEGLDAAKQARELRRRTVEALAAGVSAVNSAASARDIRAQKKSYDTAMARFKSCQNDGASMLQQRSSLTGIAVVVDGHPSTPKDVLALCAQQQEATAELLRKAEGLISFEDGPKQSFEKAKGLLAKGAKSDALAQFRECIATGRILDHFNPELKDRKFEVAGVSWTLVELIEQCVKQRDALDTK